MNFTDTHLHLWDPSVFPYSWCAGIPELNRPFTIGDYLEASTGTGISRALFMECDVDEPYASAEARRIASLAVSLPLIAGIVASARPEREDFSAQIEELLDIPGIKGIRRVLHTVPDELSSTSLFSGNISLLAAHGLTFDICVLARQLPLAIDLIRRCPGVSFVLDHCGLQGVESDGLSSWKSDLRNLAQLPNVVCKLSGLSTAPVEGWGEGGMEDSVEHVLDCFGTDRILWGGDWPVCVLGSGLAGWVDRTRDLLSPLSESDREKIFSRNSTRIYRLG